MRLLTTLVVLLAVQLFAQDELPPGKGKETAERMCTSCHGLEMVTPTRLSRAGWAAMVDQMVGRGAIGTDEEVAEVVAYLAAVFPKPVNVNKAAAAELQSGLALTAAQAEALIKARPLRELADLKKIPGLDTAKIEGIKAAVTF